MSDIIGEEIRANVLIDGERWLPIEMEVNRDKSEKIDTVVMTAVPDPDRDDEIEPNYEDPIWIDVDSRPPEEDGIRHIYSGFVSSRFNKGDERWRIRGVNAMALIRNSNVSLVATGQRPVSRILEDISDQLGLEIKTRLQREPVYYVGKDDNLIEFYRTDIHNTQDTSATSGVTEKDVQASVDVTERNGAKILTALANLTNATWYVDKYNRIWFGRTNTSVHDLGDPFNQVVDASAGKDTPPYRSVKVVGSGIVSKTGWEGGKRIMPKDSVVLRANFEAKNDVEVGEGEYLAVNKYIPEGQLKEPTFVFRSEAIKTQRHADQVANNLLAKLQEQIGGGWIEVVGRPNITPYDVVQTPDQFTITSGGNRVGPASYIVTGVKHTIDNSTGFITRIQCGGVAGEYSGDVLTQGDLQEFEVRSTTPTSKGESASEDDESLDQSQTVQNRPGPGNSFS